MKVALYFVAWIVPDEVRLVNHHATHQRGKAGALPKEAVEALWSGDDRCPRCVKRRRL